MTMALLNVLLMLPATLLGCSSTDPLPAQGDGAAPATARVALPPITPVIVVLQPPAPQGAFRYETETIGIYTLLLEAGLMEMHGVIAVMGDRPAPPGVTRPVGLGQAQRWTAGFTIGSNPDALEVEFELCTAGRKRCRSTATTGRREAPELAVAKFLHFASEVLEREPAPRAITQWTRPVSNDPYAVLICGRSAAAWYGMIEVAPEDRGQKSKDPILRAVHLDPSMALAQWLLARRFVSLGRWDPAMPAFAAAREGRPLAPVFIADEAMAMEAGRRSAAAADSWDALLDAVPRDPRFMLARAETNLRAKRLDTARDALEELVIDWPTDSAIAAARVDLADKRGEFRGMDELLAHWAETDPTEVEPVRRRIQLRIRQNNYTEAWDMLPELRKRGADPLADQYQLPLGVALGEWETAAKAAERSGNTAVAARIRARKALIDDPSKAPTLAGGLGPDGYLVLGWVALRQGHPKEALAYAEAADKLRPWDPDILMLSRDALASLGNTPGAQRVATRIAEAEPPSPAVMVLATAAR